MNSKILLLEFSPAAEEIWRIKKSEKEGYSNWNQMTGEVIFKDVMHHDAKIRPEIMATYAGGKNANVARVLQGLRNTFDGNYILILNTCLPFDKKKQRYSPGARYIQNLYDEEFFDIELVYKKINGITLDKDRRAVHILDHASNRDMVNFTPRLKWKKQNVEEALLGLNDMGDVQNIALSGTPPKNVPFLYAEIIKKIKKTNPEAFISADISGESLAMCLENIATHPHAICINKSEYDEIRSSAWSKIEGDFYIHNKDGCWFWQGKGNELKENPNTVPFLNVEIHKENFGRDIGPTLGAGDAFHAGVIAAKIKGFKFEKTVILGQATASACVRSKKGITGLSFDKAKHFNEILLS